MEGIMQWLKHRRRSPWILERAKSSYRICLFRRVCRKNLALRTVLFNLCNVCFNFKFWRAMVFFSTDKYTVDLSLNQCPWAQIWLHEVAVGSCSHDTFPPQSYPWLLEFKLSSPLLLWEENLPSAIFFNKNFSLVRTWKLSFSFECSLTHSFEPSSHPCSVFKKYSEFLVLCTRSAPCHWKWNAPKPS